MYKVPRTFTEGTYQYRQLQRHGMVAIYCQEHQQTGTQRFEVVRLRVRKAYTWPMAIRRRSMKRTQGPRRGEQMAGHT